MQDATVQSIPQTSPAPQAVAPSNYVAAPAPQAPAPQMQAPVATSYQQTVPAADPNYQSAPSQYAPQSQPAPQVSNPWESAFNKVVGVLSSPVQSPFQAPPSAPTSQPTPVNYAQAPAAPQVTPQSDPLTWSPSQDLSPNYSQTSLNPSLEEAAFDQEVADYYNLSQESREVIDAYGVEAPAVLNQYALNLEGMLDSAVAWGQQAQDVIKGYANFAVQEHQENLAYNEILTNPDTLSDYTLKFFGPEGPYPVYESETELETPGYPTQTPNVGYQMQPGVAMPAPPTAEAPQAPADFWGSFSNQMDSNPAEAWRLLNQAQPQTVANKLFVME